MKAYGAVDLTFRNLSIINLVPEILFSILPKELIPTTVHESIQYLKREENHSGLNF
jgi:hypothetical protein